MLYARITRETGESPTQSTANESRGLARDAARTERDDATDPLLVVLDPWSPGGSLVVPGDIAVSREHVASGIFVMTRKNANLFTSWQPARRRVSYRCSMRHSFAVFCPIIPPRVIFEHRERNTLLPSPPASLSTQSAISGANKTSIKFRRS